MSSHKVLTDGTTFLKYIHFDITNFHFLAVDTLVKRPIFTRPQTGVGVIWGHPVVIVEARITYKPCSLSTEVFLGWNIWVLTHLEHKGGSI